MWIIRLFLQKLVCFQKLQICYLEPLKSWTSQLHPISQWMPCINQVNLWNLLLSRHTSKIDVNRRLITDLYCKPMDAHNYLHYRLAHHHAKQHHVWAIPKTEMHLQSNHRLWQKCSDVSHTLGSQRNPNLRDLLVQAKLQQIPDLPRNITDMSSPKHKYAIAECRYYTILDTTWHHNQSPQQKTTTPCKAVSCLSNNLIYCISCTRCGKQHVDQTKRLLMDRFHAGSLWKNFLARKIMCYYRWTFYKCQPQWSQRYENSYSANCTFASKFREG